MNTILNTYPRQLSLRSRLTLWYSIALSLLFILFFTFLYFQVQRSLISQIDAALALASQSLINIDDDDGELAFENSENVPRQSAESESQFIIHLVSANGQIWDSLSNENQSLRFPTQFEGYHTFTIEDESWRVYMQPVTIDNVAGYIQVAQELDSVSNTLTNLRTQFFLVLPLALLATGIGGYFLASGALRPLLKMTQTIQSISANNLSQRVNYQGAKDELGNLAEIFDSMLERIEAAFEREQQFTDNAAHELRTPIAALKSRIGVTNSQLRRPKEYQEALQEMEEQVDRLARISNDLLFMVRLNNGQIQQAYESIDLSDFIASIVDQITPLAESKNIAIQINIPSQFTVNGNIDLLIHLYLNLLDNAVKYTPQGGKITIYSSIDNDFTNVSIQDNGIGIPAEHLPYLFDRFYRADQSRTRQNSDQLSGTGLGLAIANEIAQAHKGSLLIESTVGQGTTVTFKYPNHLSPK